MATKTIMLLSLLMSAIAVDSKFSQKARVFPKGMLAHPQKDAAVNDAGSHGCFSCSEVESMLLELKDSASLDDLIEKKISDLKANPSCIPKSCSDLRNHDPSATNGDYTIDPDGEGSLEPFTVFCDMSDQNGVGVTVVSHDSESRKHVQDYESHGSYSREIHYIGASLSQLASLTRVSSNCEQFIKYECYHAMLLREGYGWWVSRDSSNMTYWGGAEPGSGKCACGMTNSCVNPKYGCNCDDNENVWREDSGLLTDKSHLPVTQLRFGDTGIVAHIDEEGYHTLGKLKCYGIA